MSINEALIDVVKALGGSKQVGPRLWPDKTPDAAQRLLLDCLNDDRPAHLTPEQMVFVLRLARERGIHTGMNALCEALSYAEPQPIEPKDEAAELQRAYIEAVKHMATLTEKLERVSPRLRAAA